MALKFKEISLRFSISNFDLSFVPYFGENAQLKFDVVFNFDIQSFANPFPRAYLLAALANLAGCLGNPLEIL